MKLRDTSQTKTSTKTRSLWPAACLIAVICYPIGVLAQAKSPQVISQMNRTYAPEAVTISAGESLKIVNDDIFLHHAFIESDNMEFDSGSMDEGEFALVTFDTPGMYQVKCAIHPKMNLDVTVK